MKKLYMVFAVVGVALMASVGYVLAGDRSDPNIEKFSFTYNDSNSELQLLLVEYDIHMSSPLKLNGFSIEKYCTFFSDDAIQNSIEYCTSTELLDSNRAFLGNIQMVGSNQRPEYVLGVIQADMSASQLDDLKTVMKVMIDTLVCTCWEEDSPGGFSTVSDWVDAAREHHEGGVSATSKSEISNLAGKHLLLEVTTNSEGNLWKFVISN